MSSLEKEWLTYPRGSDIDIELPFEDDDDVPIPMTGWNISLFEAGPAGPTAAYVEANAVVSWLDQAGGVGRFFLPWNAAAPSYFTVRLLLSRVSDGHDDGIDEILVRYT